MPTTIGNLLDAYEAAAKAKDQADANVAAANRAFADATEIAAASKAKFLRGLVKVGPTYRDNGDGTETEYYPNADGSDFGKDIIHGVDTVVPDDDTAPVAPPDEPPVVPTA